MTTEEQLKPKPLIIESIERMPNLSPTVAKVLALVNDPDSSARDLIRVIQIDPVLTGKVLSLCNSAYFGIRKRISSVARATVLLGMNTIKNLALTSAVLALFSTAPRKARFDSSAFWEHSLGCAVGCRLIAAMLKFAPAIQEEFFVAGLLHDSGRLVVVHQLPDRYREIVDAASESDRSVLEIEEEVLGGPHTEIGFLLGKKWKLAEHLSMAILHHHNPTEAEKFVELAAGCHIADVYCERTGIGVGGDTADTKDLKEASARLGKDLKEVITVLHEKMEAEMGKASIFLVRRTA